MKWTVRSRAGYLQWTPRREEKAGMDGATAAQPPRAKKNEMAADAAEKRMRDEKVTGAEGEIS